MSEKNLYVPEQIRQWAEERAGFRAEKNWEQADAMRDRIAAVGYVVRDDAEGVAFDRVTIDDLEDVASNLETDSTLDWTTVILARDRDDDLTRAVQSAVQHGAGHAHEVVVVGNGEEATHDVMADLAVTNASLRPLYTTRNLGEGASLGAALRAARGANVLIMGVHIELTADPFEMLAATLANDGVGVTGGWGAVAIDPYNYEASQGPEVDAVEFYLFAFRRAVLREVGLPDPRFEFYRNLDLDWSLAFKDKGYRLVVTPDLPATTHEHIWYRLDPDEVKRLSQKNYGMLLEKWQDRFESLVSYGRDASS